MWLNADYPVVRQNALPAVRNPRSRRWPIWRAAAIMDSMRPAARWNMRPKSWTVLSRRFSFVRMADEHGVEAPMIRRLHRLARDRPSSPDFDPISEKELWKIMEEAARRKK